MADVLFKQTSFTAFTNAYNYLYSPRHEITIQLNAKRLADVFFCFNLQQYYNEFMKTPLICNMIEYKLITDKNLTF